MLTIVITLVTGEYSAFRHVKVILLQSAGITLATRSQEKIDRLTRFSNHQMNLQSITMKSFAGLVATIIIFPLNSAVLNAIVFEKLPLESD